MEIISQSISKLFRTSGKRAKQSFVLPEGLCRTFSLAEIKKATNNFDVKLLINDGGSCSIYKGFIDDCTKKVAVKKFNTYFEERFGTEILLLCQLRHHNLVNLIGYCTDKLELILVFELIANGSLSEHLSRDQDNPLPWKRRLEICIGVARGLHYLHSGVKHTIIHRDVKSSNILLDENWEAKLKGFCFAKMGPPSLSKALIRIESLVVGSFGYLDPVYFQTSELTDKSDVYSFGVVLFEVLCARRAANSEVERGQRILASWALNCVEDGTINEIIDPYLKGKIAPECFKIYVNIATSCLQLNDMKRPTISEVDVGLEHALELQECADAAIRKDGVESGSDH
ncbi:receptor-like protein kinase FERONIA [Quercus lobata]|uniref:Protein kinase domain-containing protein n=1 Tax=Quercus lobata TaxID=97700 RepID=A0A7N2LQZ9_QUELO|nr:receptor-like protein kinase FERONIA [Quercus lobata]